MCIVCAANAELDGSIFQGRLIHILPGKRPPAPAEAAEGEGEEGKSGKAGTSRCVGGPFLHAP